MNENLDLIDVSDLLKHVAFHGKTYVSKKVFNQIIEPQESIYGVLGTPEKRLFELYTGSKLGESFEIRNHHSAHNVRHFIYSSPTLDGNRCYAIKSELNYFEGDRGTLKIMMDNEE